MRLRPTIGHRLVAVLAGLLALSAAGLVHSQTDTRRSGLHFTSPALQTLQRDDSQNPGLLAVLDGAALWRSRAGSVQKSCADCHGGYGEAPRSMAGVATRYPAWDAGLGVPLNLASRINTCRH